MERVSTMMELNITHNKQIYRILGKYWEKVFDDNQKEKINSILDFCKCES